MSSIPEALLEMYYFKVLPKLFSSYFGLKCNLILKPTPYEEAWIGFDSGLARASMTDSELSKKLIDEIKRNTLGRISNFYLGFFLQYKVVHPMQNCSVNLPRGYSTPYYRVELDLRLNKTTNLSQHHTLLRLRSIPNANVFYACPMIFERSDLFNRVDTSRLRLVDIITSPPYTSNSGRHFIAFQSPDDPNPIWKSEEKVGSSMSMDDWLMRSKEMNRTQKIRVNDSISFPPLKLMSAEEVYSLIAQCQNEILKIAGIRYASQLAWDITIGDLLREGENRKNKVNVQYHSLSEGREALETAFGSFVLMKFGSSPKQ